MKKQIIKGIKPLFGILLSVCVILSMFSVCSIISVTADNSNGYMLQANAEKGKYFNQAIELEKGKTYIYSFSYNYVSNPWANRLSASARCTIGGLEKRIDMTKLPDDESIYRQNWQFTVPDNAKVNANNKVKVKVGIYIYLEADQNGYFADFSLVESSDTNKTNLFVNGDLSNGTTGWNAPTSVAVVEKDIKLFTKPTEPDLEGDFMIYGIGSKGATEFGQWVELEADKTYLYTSTYKQTSIASRTVSSGMGYMTNSGAWNSNLSPLKTTLKGLTRTLEFKAPDDALTLQNGRKFVFVKITMAQAGGEINAANFSLKVKDDSESPNLFINPDFKKGLYGWTVVGCNQVLEHGVMESPTVQVKLLPLDKELLGLVEDEEEEEPVDGYMMQSLGLTQGEFFGQTVELEKGKTYTYSFSYNYGRNTWENKICAWVRYTNETGLTRMNITELDEDEKLYRQNWQFTVPDDAVTNSNGKAEVKAGIYLGKKGQTGNFADFSLVENTDVSKTNLFVNGDFSDGFKGWCGAGMKNPVTDSGIKTTPNGFENLVAKKTELFTKPEKVTSNQKYMVHTVGSQGATEFGQWVELEEGKTYVYKVTSKSIRGSIRAFPELGCFTNNKWVSNMATIDQSNEGDVAIYTFNTDAVDVLQNGKRNVYIKITMSKNGGESYSYDFSLKEKDNPNAKELLVNNDFSMGLYGWSCAGSSRIMESGVMKSPTYQAEVVLYDPMAFVDDSSDAEFNDDGWELEFTRAQKEENNADNKQEATDNKTENTTQKDDIIDDSYGDETENTTDDMTQDSIGDEENDISKDLVPETGDKTPVGFMIILFCTALVGVLYSIKYVTIKK